MKRIGITGQIGAGKSYVGSLLRSRNFCVLDADLACHELYRNSKELRAEITHEFGSEALTPEGINRQFFADLIFKDAGARLRLENLVYPRLVRYTLDFFRDCESNCPAACNDGKAFVEAALFESVPDLVKHLDEIWVVTASAEVRLKRLVENRGLSPEDASRRMELQKSKDCPECWLKLFPGKKIHFIDNAGEQGLPQLPFSQFLSL